MTSDHLYCHQPETLHLDSARQSTVEAKRSDRGIPFPSGKGDEEDRLGEVAASPNSKFQADGGISSAAVSWAKFSLEEQLGNIGSEVSRAIRAKGESEYYWGAVARALELFYLTIEDLRWRGRLKEIVRVKELFCAAALGSDEYKTSLEDLDAYFRYFALLARARRQKFINDF